MTDMEFDRVNHAAVEELMVQSAERKSVALFVRSAGLMPFNALTSIAVPSAVSASLEKPSHLNSSG